jgi:protein MpaA
MQSMLVGQTQHKVSEAQSRRRRRSIADLLAPLEVQAEKSPNLLIEHGARFVTQGETYELPRYRFVGPQGGDAPIRVGIFAGIHGDKPEGAYAAVHFLKLLEQRPELARGYCLSVYPVCNPTAFEDSTRHSRSGKDLNREFWKNSQEPEVRLLEHELQAGCFHGIISLHTDGTATGVYGVARGALLTRQLIEPALQAAEVFLPRDKRAIIHGLPSEDGIMHNSHPGMLSAPPMATPRPFEIVLETPQWPPAFVKEGALALALRTILSEYTKFIAYARNL